MKVEGVTWRRRLFDLSEAGRISLLRLVGLAYVGFSVLVWGQLLGIEMPGMVGEPSQVSRAVGVALAVLGPVVALGLWSLAAWGQVVWAIALTLHVVAIVQDWPVTARPEIALAFHVACVATFAVLVLVRLVANKG